MTGHIYIIRGLPGSGKTTLAATMLVAGMVDDICEADQFRVNERGEYVFDAKGNAAAHTSCLKKCAQSFADGKIVAVANTFVRKWEIEPYLRLDPSATIIICRGSWPNIHGVPDDVVSRMRDAFE